MHVLITDYDFPDLSIEEAIFEQAGVKLSSAHCRSEDEVIETARGLGDVQAIIAQYMPLGSRTFDALPDLGFVGRYGIGYDTVDVPAATQHGVVVVNVPDYCINEVADHAMALLLAGARRIVALDAAVHTGRWDVIGTAGAIRDMSELTLGLLGAGRIGRSVARRAQSFGMRVIAHDPPLPEQVAAEAGITLVDMETLLSESDFLSLHALLNTGTRHIIGERELARMKPTAWIVNTARGGLIDTTALVAALSEGRLAGASLDVLEKEPVQADNPLLDLPNVILTPHAAWYSQASIIRLRQSICAEVLRWSRGEQLRSPVNPDALKRREAQ